MDLQLAKQQAQNIWSYRKGNSAICDICSASIDHGEGYLVGQPFTLHVQDKFSNITPFSAHWPFLVCDDCINKYELIAWDGPVEFLQDRYALKFQNRPIEDLIKEGQDLIFETKRWTNKETEKLGTLIMVLLDNGVAAKELCSGLLNKENSKRTQWLREIVTRVKRDQFEKAKQEYEQPGENKSNDCFIATATLGNDNHYILDTLRSFRDEWLNNKSLGRQFIHIYYRYSPPVANIIRKHYFLRQISYYLIVLPVFLLAKRIAKTN